MPKTRHGELGFVAAVCDRRRHAACGQSVYPPWRASAERKSRSNHASILPICQIGNTVSMMKTISLKLPAPLANWLAKRANELGRSRSDLVRQALEEQRQRKNRKSEKSCAELMAEFSGFFQGPRDLSTNPKYMRDFGK
jgi:Arc/MetJ-type ribon-helix-helix transcriptional regulator